ncbi:EAL domain-containing protein [Fictibacillus arsenicus]|uniref:Histidine kinase n=1 Tax=Fictibacillus arsenicus TaxID=255247 RepID=A0A1V3GDR9_9BACL|nr:EAL domain-containing protein [Fictibacillus arsenicus]OOE14561.1 histidine kinase [Fictibacillus arsenicus]
MSEAQTRYSRLANITKLINTKLELKDVLEHVVSAISEEIVQCDSIGIYLPQDNGTFRGYAGKPDVINGITLDKLIIDPKVDLLAREVLDTKEAIYIPDTSMDNRPDPGPIRAFSIKSLLCLPIFNGDETYGLVFLFDYGIPMNLTETEIQTVEAYVNMAAVAIRNANHLNRKEDLLAEKQLLLDVNRDLSECSTMQEVLDKCFLYVGKVLGNSNIGAHIMDPIAEKKIRPSSLSKESDWTEEDWKKTHGKIKVDFKKDPLFQEVITTKKAVYIPDVFKDSRPNHDACRSFGIKGLYMMPLVAMGEVLGTIPVVNLHEGYRNYSEMDLQLSQSIVDATALALFNLLIVEKQEMIIQERTSELLQKNEELNEAVSKLSRLSREIELILDSAGEGIFGLDLDGKFTFCNPAAASMLGYEAKEELIGQPFHNIYKTLNYKEDGMFIIPENSFLTDKHFFKNDGTPFPVEFVTSTIIEDAEIVGYVITFKDNTIRKKMEEKIKYHAYYDSSTNLPNRVMFRDKLNKELLQAEVHNEQLAVMFLDLDRFKTINDTMGHSFGDALLKKVAERLVSFIPEECTVSRQGGDEFTIILPKVKCEEEVRIFSERILESFSSSFDLDGNEVFIKTSIGISLYPKDGATSDVLIKNADTAMYKAKESSGGNYCLYENSMDFRSLDSIKLESDLNKALQNDEFIIYYQPQVDFSNNKIIGVEALLRWNHPVRGMISPLEFIPIAEETGLIVSIGEWVLKTACIQIKKWHNQGLPPIYLSVNMAAQQFNQKKLIPMIHEILQESGLSPEFLVLELTENAIIQDTEATLCNMKQLKEMGIKIAIDDFGTGYSSLGYLKNYPIDILKIDQTFVQDIVQDKNNAAITNTIISLAKNLNLNVIAEGVETKEQIDFLLSSECSHMQGYYFSPPVSGEEAEKMFYSTIKK